MKIERKVLVTGTIKDIKSGKGSKGNWVLVKLEQGKGTENIFVDDFTILKGKKLAELNGHTITLEGELWRNKQKNYNFEYAKMKIISIKKDDTLDSEDIPFL